MKLDPFVIITGSFCGFEVELRQRGLVARTETWKA